MAKKPGCDFWMAPPCQTDGEQSSRLWAMPGNSAFPNKTPHSDFYGRKGSDNIQYAIPIGKSLGVTHATHLEMAAGIQQKDGRSDFKPRFFHKAEQFTLLDSNGRKIAETDRGNMEQRFHNLGKVVWFGISLERHINELKKQEPGCVELGCGSESCCHAKAKVLIPRTQKTRTGDTYDIGPGTSPLFGKSRYGNFAFTTSIELLRQKAAEVELRKFTAATEQPDLDADRQQYDGAFDPCKIIYFVISPARADLGGQQQGACASAAAAVDTTECCGFHSGGTQIHKAEVAYIVIITGGSKANCKRLEENGFPCVRPVASEEPFSEVTEQFGSLSLSAQAEAASPNVSLGIRIEKRPPSQQVPFEFEKTGTTIKATIFIKSTSADPDHLWEQVVFAVQANDTLSFSRDEMTKAIVPHNTEVCVPSASLKHKKNCQFSAGDKTVEEFREDKDFPEKLVDFIR